MTTLTKEHLARFDKGQTKLLRLMRETEAGAEEMCEIGEFDLSARLHRMAAYFRLAYAEGRAATDNAGQFTVKSGSK